MTQYNKILSSAANCALQYYRLGLQIIPAYSPAEIDNWKRPRFIGWKKYQNELVSDQQFDSWFGPKGQFRETTNIGLVTGACSGGVFVLDIDTYKDPEAWKIYQDFLNRYNGSEPFKTPTQTTGGGGKQILLRAPSGVIMPTSTNKSVCIDIRGQGGFAILAPSIHQSGKEYKWDEGLAPSEVNILEVSHELAEEFKNLFKKKASSVINSPQLTFPSNNLVRPVIFENNTQGMSDGREAFMTQLVCSKMVSIYSSGTIEPSEIDNDKIYAELWPIYEARVVSRLDIYGLQKHELLDREDRGPRLMREKILYMINNWQTRVADLVANQKTYSSNMKVNDDYNNEQNNSSDKKKGSPDQLKIAREALKLIGEDNIICSSYGFRMWDSSLGVWKLECEENIKKYIHLALRKIHEKVNSSLVNGVIAILKTEIYRCDHKFNLGHPETINCRNGELELRDGTWRLAQHRRELYRTTQIATSYYPDAKAPKFLKFLEDIFLDDEDKKDKIQALLELIAYTLMSHARHEKFVILIGNGANGKSVLLAILQALCGIENVAAVQPSNFHRAFQRAHLDQKLANIITEIAQGEIIADAELKGITSGEPSTVEHKYGDPFVMYPFATCWFGTNHLPRTKDFSDALFRRATIITFNRTFRPSEQDPLLKECLKEELPGILLMALDAYALAQENGFTEPQSSKETKGEWRKEADQVAQFLDERTEHAPQKQEPFQLVYSNYEDWAVNEGIQHKMSKRGFRERLSRLGYGNKRDNKTRYVTDLRVLIPF